MTQDEHFELVPNDGWPIAASVPGGSLPLAIGLGARGAAHCLGGVLGRPRSGRARCAVLALAGQGPRGGSARGRSFGKVVECHIVRDPKTAESLCYGFVEFEKTEAALEG